MITMIAGYCASRQKVPAIILKKYNKSLFNLLLFFFLRGVIKNLNEKMLSKTRAKSKIFLGIDRRNKNNFKKNLTFAENF